MNPKDFSKIIASHTLRKVTDEINTLRKDDDTNNIISTIISKALAEGKSFSQINKEIKKAQAFKKK